MRVLIQRVTNASVKVNETLSGQIGRGLLLLVGVAPDDQAADIDWHCRKISQLRIFEDDAGVMNLSVMDVGADILAVSQFTLFASVRKGNRPSYSRAAAPSISLSLFDAFVAQLSRTIGRPVATGVFGADMQVSLTNNGPVTIWLDSQNPE